MKEFIKNLIVRLEELKIFKLALADAISELMEKDKLDNYISKEEVVKIINELAEEYKPKTQADKIRSMSDEELAELFTKLAWNSEVQTTPLKYLDWLQSEVEQKEAELEGDNL